MGRPTNADLKVQFMDALHALGVGIDTRKICIDIAQKASFSFHEDKGKWLFELPTNWLKQTKDTGIMIGRFVILSAKRTNRSKRERYWNVVTVDWQNKLRGPLRQVLCEVGGQYGLGYYCFEALQEARLRLVDRLIGDAL